MSRCHLIYKIINENAGIFTFFPLKYL